METDEEVKELEELLYNSEFKPIESPIKRWIDKFRFMNKNKQNRKVYI